MTKLPAHLEALVNKIEADHKKFGLVPMSEILANQQANMDANDFHILHALASF